LKDASEHLLQASAQRNPINNSIGADPCVLSQRRYLPIAHTAVIYVDNAINVRKHKYRLRLGKRLVQLLTTRLYFFLVSVSIYNVRQTIARMKIPPEWSSVRMNWSPWESYARCPRYDLIFARALTGEKSFQW